MGAAKKRVATTKKRRAPASRAPQAIPGRKRSDQKLATRERITRAAWELFNRDGYDATTTKAVADRAGVAAGTVFVHARDKPELLFLVMGNMIQETVEQAFATLPDKAPFIDRVLHLFRGPVSYYARHPQVARAFIRMLPGADGPNAQQVNAGTFAFIQRLRGVITTAIDRGELASDFDVGLAASAIFALYFVNLMAWMTGLAPIDAVLEPGLRNGVTLLVRGLHT
jgi:AcrR family transcriptional regulator